MNDEQLLEKVIEIVELFELVNKANFQDVYNGLSINEVHTIDYVGSNKKPKLTDVANYLKITRGGATKITKRLIDEGYIQDYKLSSNKKEKYFKLTIRGKDIFNKHKLIHEESVRRDSKMFSELTDEERIVAFKFLGILEMDLIDKLKNNYI